MTFELGYFWHFYSVAISNNEEDLNDLDPIEELDNEFLRIIERLNCYAPVKENGSLKKYLRIQQRSMVRLIKSVEDQILNKDKVPNTSIEILEKLQTLTEKLLDHMLEYHTKYFDYREMISKRRLKTFELTKSKKIEQIEKIYSESTPNPFHLIKELFGYSDLSFKKMYRQTDLIEILNDNPEKINTETGLTNMLLKAGFDHPEFIEYYLQDLRNEISQERTIAGQYKSIIYKIKQIDQLLWDENHGLGKSCKRIKAKLIGFLTSELKFLKELDFITYELVNTGILEADYKVALSVKQLAFYVFLNVECGIITEQRPKKIHEYVISHVGTSEKEGISEKSFKNAYYIHAPEDIKKIMEKLSRMLAMAQSHY